MVCHFWYHADFYVYKAKKKLTMAEERDNMIFGKFGGIYYVCTEKTRYPHYRALLSSASFPNVGNSNLLLEKSSISEQVCKNWYMNQNT
jgi:hypothetical protein